MSVLAIVPARSGSKSAPHKNVASFRGRPLLAHSVEHALRARNVDRVLVSTDSPRYRELALAAGAEVPFLRPAELAQDLSTDLEVFRHALEWLDAHEGYRPDVLVHLRPTAPTRRVADVENAVDLLLSDPDADSVRSVVEAPAHAVQDVAGGRRRRPAPAARRVRCRSRTTCRASSCRPSTCRTRASTWCARGSSASRRSMTGTRVAALRHGAAWPTSTSGPSWRGSTSRHPTTDRRPA